MTAVDGSSDAAEIKRPGMGIAVTVVAVTVWGGASILVKTIDGVDGSGISFYRLLFGSVFLAAFHMIRGGRIDRRLLVDCTPGGIAFGLDIVLYFSALRETSIANATIIGALQPILLLPFGVRWFGERTTRRGVVFCVVAVVGTGLVVFGNTTAPTWSPVGDLLAVGALLSWTAYFLTAKRVRETRGAVEYFTGVSLISFVVIAPFVIGVGADLTPSGPSDWAAIVSVTLMSGALGHLLVTWAHGHVPLQVMSILTLLVPLVATVAAVVFLDEHVNLLQWAGMAVVLGALVEVVRNTRR